VKRSLVLPAGWSGCLLGELASVIRGVTYQKEEARATAAVGFVPLLRATNIGASLDLDDVLWVPASRVKPLQRLQVGDIVVAASSGSAAVVGKAAQLLEDWDGTFGAFCFALRPANVFPGTWVTT
jgi:type I restriction enzyme S subunit